MIAISIIVPVYNVEKYLERCLDSIINQTQNDLEIILVDDGSTDNSGNICDKYAIKDKRIKVIHKENKGLADARNCGLDLAQGECVSFIDGDDFIHPQMMEILYNNINNNNADIASCEFKKVYEYNKKEIASNTREIITREYDNIQALENYFGEYRDKKEMQIVVWNKIYRRELFDNIKFPYDKLYEDGYVTYKLLYKSKKIIHIYEELYYYFQREGSLIRSEFSLKVLRSYDDRREIFNFLYNKVPSINRKSAEGYINKYFTLYKQIISSNTNDEEILLYKDKIKNDLKQDKKLLLKSGINNLLKLKLVFFILNYKFIYFFEVIENLMYKIIDKAYRIKGRINLCNKKIGQP